VDEGGSVDGVSLSLKRLRGGPGGGGASSLGTLESMLKKTLDAVIPPCGGPLVV
jgi:hypothetical protein